VGLGALWLLQQVQAEPGHQTAFDAFRVEITPHVRSLYRNFLGFIRGMFHP